MRRVQIRVATTHAHEYRDAYVQQIYWLVGGGILATVVAAVDYRHYERLGYAVYVGGRYVGRDPDPNIRAALIREYYERITHW